MSDRRYWLGLGPITKDERTRAFSYFRKHNKPFDRNSDAFRNFVARLRKRREVNRYLKGKAPATAEPSAPWQILYGDVRTGGTLTFAHTTGPDNDPNRHLHLVITLAAHEIHRIVAVYFDDYQVSWDTDLSTRPTGEVNATGIFAGVVKMQINYGSDDQAALSVPVNDTTDDDNAVSTKWTGNHRQRGHAHVYFRLTYNENIFKNGQPDIDFRVLGNAAVVDPRTGSASPGASNAAMVLYDYMTNPRYGMGLSTGMFNADRWEQACDDCEDAIDLAGGGTQSRYLINAIVTADESPGGVVDEMLASMAGRLAYTEGKFSLHVGKGRAGEGHVLEIDEDMILSDVKIITKTPRIDSFNRVRGTFISEANSHEESDFPVVRNATYVAEDDGKVIAEDLTFGMVTDAIRCQRLAKIELESGRQGIFAELTCTLEAYQAEPGEWVGVTFSRFGWSSKTFEVVRSQLQIEEADGGVPSYAMKLTLKETSSAIYDWDTGNETTYDVAPNTNLPDPFAVAAPTSLSLASGTDHLYIRSDGTVFARLYLSWTGAADTFVRNGGYYEVQFKRSSSSDWQDYGDVPGSSTTTYILDVEDGATYDVRIRSVNAPGGRSEWLSATGHTVVGKTAAPSDVTGFGVAADGFGVRLSWGRVSDLDVKEYELRHGTTAQDWAEMAATAIRVQATTFFFKTFAAGTHRFRIKAVDTSGNYSDADASADLVVAAPGAVANLTANQIDGTALIDWEEGSSGTFPVAGYNVYRENASGTVLLGAVTGTFFSAPVLIPGAVTFKIAAYDTAGNEGTLATVDRVLYLPPDFEFQSSNDISESAATLVNAKYEPNVESVFFSPPGVIVMPIDTTETWEDHFLNNNATCFQDLIDAGYTHYCQPNETVASGIEVTHDLGAVVPLSVISFFVYVIASDGYTGDPFTVTISWRASTSDSWTSRTLNWNDSVVGGVENQYCVSASNFRYLKAVIENTVGSLNTFAAFRAFNFSVDTKEVVDGGTIAVSASDVGGTTVPFNKSFLSVRSITVTAQGTTELKAVRDFTDSPNPTSFKVYLFNAAGVRVSGTVSWSAKGILAVI